MPRDCYGDIWYHGDFLTGVGSTDLYYGGDLLLGEKGGLHYRYWENILGYKPGWYLNNMMGKKRISDNTKGKWIWTYYEKRGTTPWKGTHKYYWLGPGPIPINKLARIDTILVEKYIDGMNIEFLILNTEDPYEPTWVNVSPDDALDAPSLKLWNDAQDERNKRMKEQQEEEEACNSAIAKVKARRPLTFTFATKKNSRLHTYNGDPIAIGGKRQTIKKRRSLRKTRHRHHKRYYSLDP